MYISLDNVVSVQTSPQVLFPSKIFEEEEEDKSQVS